MARAGRDFFFAAGLISAGILGVACGAAEPDEGVGASAAALTTTRTPVADSYLDEDRRNQAFGTETVLRLDGDDRDRALLRFDLAGLAGTRIASAQLRLSVVDAPRGCRANGLRLGAFRMRRGWTESGATFACPNDLIPGNARLDCPGGTWAMDPPGPNQAPWISPATSITTLSEGRTDTVSFDVTADVRAFVAGTASNDGWLVQKLTHDDEGRVTFGSRESARKPELVIVFDAATDAGPDARDAAPDVPDASPDVRDAAPDVLDAGPDVIDASETGPDAETDAGTDAGPVVDAGGDAGGGGGGADAGIDSGVVPDSGADAGPSCVPANCDDGLACTADSCLAGVCVHTPLPTGSACGGDICQGIATCDSAGVCQPGLPPDLHDSDGCTLDSCSVATGITHTPIPGCGAPIVPSAVDPTVVTDFASATSFLFTGVGAPQQNVTPGAIAALRQSVLRGRTLSRAGAPLAGIRVEVVGHPEYGWTFTRSDGFFEMAVNGGTPLAVELSAPDFLPVQRRIDPTTRRFGTLDDVVMMPRDPQKTRIAMGAPGYQVARGSTQTDADGTRVATVVFAPGTLADFASPTFTVRATERTVGPSGKQAMPAELPPGTGYTYAVDLTIDEAEAAGLARVSFNQPVPVYVDNFTGFPAGTVVPVGYYDRDKAAWIGSDSGVVLTILSTTGGVAHLDVTGDGVEDTGAALTDLGIRVEEQQLLAGLYAGQNGKSLWRVAVQHFSSWDLNLGVTPPDNAPDPDTDPPQGPNPDDKPDTECGSVLECQNQILRESVPVVGTPYSLHFASDRNRGRQSRIRIPLNKGTALPAMVQRIDATVEVAGQRWKASFDRTQDSFDFVWDKTDAWGRPVQGDETVAITIGYAYRGVYRTSNRWAQPGPAILSGNRATNEVVVSQTTNVLVSNLDAKAQGLGGFELSAHHVFDPATGTLYKGDGTRRYVGDVRRVETIAGGGALPVSGVPTASGSVALGAPIFQINSGAYGPDGAFYFAESSVGLVRRVTPAGILETVAGSGITLSDTGDGGPALLASMAPTGVAVAPDGSVYIADSSHRRVRVVKNGIIQAFAGTGATGYGGDGGPAASAIFGSSLGALAVSGTGTVYIADTANHRVRAVGLDGVITTVAGHGGFDALASGNEGMATAAGLATPTALAVDSQGQLFIGDTANYTVRRVDVGGVIHAFAGHPGTGGSYAGDGGLATAASLSSPTSLAVGRDGALYILDFDAVRVVDSTGAIALVAGKFGNSIPSCTDSGAALATRLAGGGFASAITSAPDGSIVISDYASCGYPPRIRRLGPLLPAQSGGLYRIPSDDGGEIWTFDATGRHLDTREARTGGLLVSFGYESGRVATLTDGDGLVTRIVRDAQGNPERITAPFGQVTLLAVDGNGYLSEVRNPNAEATVLSHDAQGLLRQMRDARGNLHVFTYGPDGRLTADADPGGGTQGFSQVFDGLGSVVTRTTLLGRTTRYTTHDLPTGEEETVVVGPSGATSRVVRNKQDETSTMTAADGTVTQSKALDDGLWGMLLPQGETTVTTPEGLVRYTKTTRAVTLSNPLDPFSVATETSTTETNTPDCALGAACPRRTWQKVYNASTRTVTTTTPAGRSFVESLDARGRSVGFSIPGVAPTTMRFDSAGRIDQVAQAARVDTTAFSPTTGWATSFTDALGRVTSIDSRDAAGRVLAQTLPGSRVVSMTYDPNGNTTSITPPGQPAHTMDYTGLDFESKYTPPAVPGASGIVESLFNVDRQLVETRRAEGSILYGYDAFGRRASTVDPLFSALFGYNAADQLVSLTGSDGVDLTFAWDGNLLRRTIWSGLVAGSVEKRYDHLLRLKEQVTMGQSVQYAYDADDLLTQVGPVAIARDPANGRAVSTTVGGVTETFGYNAFGELETQEAKYGATPLLRRDYTRDALGRITSVTESVLGSAPATTNYTYDAAGRLDGVLSGASVVTYGYDPNGNRTHVSGVPVATYDAQDRLLTYAGATYTYTAGGDLRTKTDASGTTRYTYDLQGNLKRVDLPTGDVLEYLVDAQSRRVARKLNGAFTHRWLYEDQLRPVAELDGAGNLVSVFVYSTQSPGGAPDAIVRAGVTYRVVKDHLGSPRVIVNETSGAVVQRMDFDAWGNVLVDTNSGWQPFGFAGGLSDRTSGLVRFGARDYDPVVASWRQRDAERFAAGVNFYGYLDGDPMNEVDPTGFGSSVGPDGGDGGVCKPKPYPPRPPTPDRCRKVGRKVCCPDPPGDKHRTNLERCLDAEWRRYSDCIASAADQPNSSMGAVALGACMNVHGQEKDSCYRRFADCL